MNEAERVIRANADRIRDRIIAEIIEHHHQIIELAVQRSGPGSIGEIEYGDASFHKPPETLRRERFEEYSDAYFYAGVQFDLEDQFVT